MNDREELKMVLRGKRLLKRKDEHKNIVWRSASIFLVARGIKINWGYIASIIEKLLETTKSSGSDNI